MRAILPTILDTRYESIWAWERRRAKTVAKRVVKIPDITVWTVMIPLVFLLNILKYKRTSETFVLNILFTKRLALEAALDMAKKGQSRQDAIERIVDKTGDILASDKKGVYSDNIRRRQMEEINLLIDHYLKLLEAEGRTYESLVKNTYPTKNDYEAFLRQLTSAEKAVNKAAIQTVGKTETASVIISEMEEATESARAAEAEKIFS